MATFSKDSPGTRSKRITSAFPGAGVSESYHGCAGFLGLVPIFASDQDICMSDEAGAGGIFDLVGWVLILKLDYFPICDKVGYYCAFSFHRL